MPDRYPRLVLFFTRGVALRTWYDQGLLSRDAAVYRRMARLGADVTFVTYGGPDDLACARSVPEIRVVCNAGNEPLPEPDEPLPWVEDSILEGADIVKSHQMSGAEAALASARRLGKPFVARCGYMLSDFQERRYGVDSEAAGLARATESRVFPSADMIFVTTPMMRDDVIGRWPELDAKTRVVPNYVDTRLFAPDPQVAVDSRRVLFVGRLEQDQKNVRMLLDAVREREIGLDVIGDGPLRGEVLKLGETTGRVRWLGYVPNDALPGHLNRCAAFVLPSLYEGHPKALLEAMACGRPVVGSDVPGIREVIEHGETGWLCGASADALGETLEQVLDDRGEAARIGANARRVIEATCGLERVCEQEMALYGQLLGRATPAATAVC